MGKADMTRDYYADLELQPTADLAEIKKQFKKLALKWHPDRNPGRETEVNAKFQTIQSAHEILSDDIERRRYDAGRIRTSRFSSSTAGTRGNPFANAGSQWAPPPKPFGTPRAAAAGQGPSGADRYAKFRADASFKSPPTQPTQETKKTNYEAFERMRKNHPTGTFARTPGASAYAHWQPNGAPKTPDPKHTPQSGREESNNQKHSAPPKPSRPGFEEWNATDMHGRQSPRKSGFMPGNPGGDEPPAPTASSAYFNGRSSNRASAARNSMAPEPPPRPKASEKVRDSNGPADARTRYSTPYATHGGEKTNPFEPSTIHRSKTTRERPTANGYSSVWESRNAESSSSDNTRDKHRSASPPRSRNFREQPPQFDATTSSPPKRDYSHINSSPPPSGAGNKTRGAPRSNARFQPTAVSDTSSEGEDSEVGGVTNNHPFSKRFPRRKMPAHPEAPTTPKANVTNDQSRKPNLAEFRKMFESGDPLLNKLCSESSGNKNGSNAASQPIFPAAYKSQPSEIPPLFTASDAESINTRFETGKWDGQFRAASFVNPTEFNNGASRPQPASRSGRRSPVKSKSAGLPRSASASVHSDSQSAAFEQPQPPSKPMESPISKPFAPEEWSAPEMFRPSTFAPPTPQVSSRPPRTPSRKGSRAKASHVSKTAGGKAAVVEEDSSDSDAAPFGRPRFEMDGSNGAAPTGPKSPNAMDIDTPDQVREETSEPARKARNVPHEPMRPEWRAGATNGNTQSSKHNSDGDDDFKTNFDDLKNVEPLFQQAQGLDSVNDLKSTLPFQSKASDTIPLKSEATYPVNLKIPNPPLAPKVPSKPADGTQRMSPASWQSYLLSFKAYLTDYELYNEKIEAHFKARREGSNDIRSKIGWAWLESKSDDLLEVQMNEIKQDRLVREKWADASKGHEAAMEQFRSVRAAMMGRTEV